MEKASVKVVGAGLCDHVNDAAGCAPKLRARSSRDDLKLFDCVQGYIDCGPMPADLLSEEPVVVVAAVKADFVEDASLPGEVDLVLSSTFSVAASVCAGKQIL